MPDESKFVQITNFSTELKDDRTLNILVALDESGKVWIYRLATNDWASLGTSRVDTV